MRTISIIALIVKDWPDPSGLEGVLRIVEPSIADSSKQTPASEESRGATVERGGRTEVRPPLAR